MRFLLDKRQTHSIILTLFPVILAEFYEFLSRLKDVWTLQDENFTVTACNIRPRSYFIITILFLFSFFFFTKNCPFFFTGMCIELGKEIKASVKQIKKLCRIQKKQLFKNKTFQKGQIVFNFSLSDVLHVKPCPAEQ